MPIQYMVEELKEGGYVGYCPAMKPVVVQGATLAEVDRKIQLVAKVYLDRHKDIAKKIKITTGED